MNSKLVSFKNEIMSKRVAVLGIGISNTPLIKYLAGLGTSITAFDKASKNKLEDRLSELKEFNIKYSLGENYLDRLKGFDVIFKTPVVRHDIPELQAEKQRGAVITSEIEVFLELCPAEVFGITVSDGKTTTSTIVYHMLKEQGYKCYLGGNIGTPLLDRIDEITPDDKVVLELSSFQLMTMKVSPQVAVVTNITPNHLDIHTSLQEYIDAKKNIFKYQTKDDILVLNHDNLTSRKFEVEAPGKVLFFGREPDFRSGIHIRRNSIIFMDESDNEHSIPVDRLLLPGVHNVENIMAAIAAVSHRVSFDAVNRVASTFRGVEHRIEPVRKFNDIRFYNDSIASSPNRTIAGLNSFKEKVILIAGGKDKKSDYSELGKAIMEKVKCLVLVGETSEIIQKSYLDEVEKHPEIKLIPIERCLTLKEAVIRAYTHAKPGDVVLMSPASTSFDLYRNFEERGNVFKEIVDNLK